MGFDRVDTTSNRLQLAMSIRNKKQVDLANETGIDKGALSNYKAGRYEPKAPAVHAIAKALNVSEMWLWGYDVPMERPAEQIIADSLKDLHSRIDTEEEFRDLILKINSLNPSKLELIKRLVNEIQSD